MVDPVSSHAARWVRGNTEVACAGLAALRALDDADATLSNTQRVTLLNLSRELSDQGPHLDHVRVADIRQAIANQTYKVDPQAIAKAIIEFGRQPSV